MDEERPPARSPVTAALVASAAVAAGAVLVRAVATRWYPASDDAIILSQVHDVGGSTPLVGVYSRFGWRHPGPWLFYVLAPLYRASGAWPNAALVTTALLNAGSAAAAVRIAWRRRGRRFGVLTGVALLLLCRSFGVTALMDPWNAWVPLLPFTWLLFAAWDLVAGRRWALPIVVGVGSFVVQSHVSYGPVVGALGLWGIGAALRSCPRPRAWAAPALAAAAVGAVLWAPVAVEQMRNDPGNLTLLADFFLHGRTGPLAGVAPTPPIGPVAAAGLLARELVGGPWLGGPEPVALFSVAPLPGWLLVVPVGLLGLLGAGTIRRGERDLTLALATGAVALGAGFVALARTVGDTGDWILRFSWGIAAFLAAVAVEAAIVVVGDRVPRRARMAAARVGPWGAVAAIVVPAALLVGGALRSAQPWADDGAAIETVSDGLDAWLRAHGATTLTILGAGAGSGPVDAGVTYELARRGFDTRVGGIYRGSWPASRRVEASVGAEVVVVTGPDALVAFDGRADVEPVVRFSGGRAPVAAYAVRAGG